MSRVMRVSVVMMREAKHERALGGAAGVGRLETGAHEDHYEALERDVKCAHVARSLEPWRQLQALRSEELGIEQPR